MRAIGIGRADWEPEMRLMIDNHHKVRPYTGPYAPMVDAMRKADWLDVTFTKVRFGMPMSFVRELVGASTPLHAITAPLSGTGKSWR